MGMIGGASRSHQARRPPQAVINAYKPTWREDGRYHAERVLGVRMANGLFGAPPSDRGGFGEDLGLLDFTPVGMAMGVQEGRRKLQSKGLANKLDGGADVTLSIVPIPGVKVAGKVAKSGVKSAIKAATRSETPKVAPRARSTEPPSQAQRSGEEQRRALEAERAAVEIKSQKQNEHIPGTPQNRNLTAPKSTFFGPRSADWLTRDTASRGEPVPGASRRLERKYPVSVGTGPKGGMQRRVRVHVDNKGKVHGHPSGPERK